MKVCNGVLRASFRLRDQGFSNFVSSKSVIFYFRVCDSVIDSMIFESNYYVHCFDILPSFQIFVYTVFFDPQLSNGIVFSFLFFLKKKSGIVGRVSSFF